eukprot:SAG31_NODE_1782_length_7281_cov_5.022139_6_plen_92_part_00
MTMCRCAQATWNVLYSGLTAPAQKPGADQHDSRGPWINSEFGRITNNELWNGGNCHWFDSIHQLIYEGNTCTGNSCVPLLTAHHSIDSYLH